MKAEVKWCRGTITAESYPVLCVETDRESHGRDHIVLSMSCSAYEEDREAACKELHDIAEAINRDATSDWALCGI